MTVFFTPVSQNVMDNRFQWLGSPAQAAHRKDSAEPFLKINFLLTLSYVELEQLMANLPKSLSVQGSIAEAQATDVNGFMRVTQSLMSTITPFILPDRSIGASQQQKQDIDSERRIVMLKMQASPCSYLCPML
jgi:hypothetical protein